MNIQWYRLFVTPKDCTDILKMEDSGVINRNQRKEVLNAIFEDRLRLFIDICKRMGYDIRNK